eukprot:TRINITY_DN578_c0_g2_i1.p1 TRINITY_DN578_c0_g2~~TRINITY_DN578_c0_g2_i1.p1  ORF type:complete len:263 (+),score=74.78 TRINITY_DN578_c0_g2_i1:625-1413(+)
MVIRNLYHQILAEFDRVLEFSDKAVGEFGDEQTIDINDPQANQNEPDHQTADMEDDRTDGLIRVLHIRQLPRWQRGNLPIGVTVDDNVIHKLLRQSISQLLLANSIDATEAGVLDVISDVTQSLIEKFGRTARKIVDSNQRTAKVLPSHTMARSLELVYQDDFSSMTSFIKSSNDSNAKLHVMASKLSNLLRSITLDWNEADLYDDSIDALSEQDLQFLKATDPLFDEFDIDAIANIADKAANVTANLPATLSQPLIPIFSL